MIEKLPDFPDNIIAVTCSGRVTAHDYETVLIPHVDEVLKQHEKVRLYYQISSDFLGVDPAAVWDDMKVGMGHFRHWDRIAVVTDVGWITMAMRSFGFLIPGAVRVFPLSEAAQARQWILAE
ncbi:MAG: STAS/SEC14 domain-containing protein [Rhodanobacter sp.]|nr:STAS/SEC14 domain-containing protein [Rhodanobacter sp.]